MWHAMQFYSALLSSLTFSKLASVTQIEIINHTHISAPQRGLVTLSETRQV